MNLKREETTLRYLSLHLMKGFFLQNSITYRFESKIGVSFWTSFTHILLKSQGMERLIGDYKEILFYSEVPLRSALVASRWNEYL